jgi:F1F0 ATPase subunit 2
MTEMQAIIPALFAGMLLGTIFFGGLWWTIHKGLPSKQAALWFSVSFVVRTVVVVGGVYFVASGGWPQLAACVVGFLLARAVIVWRTRTHAPLEKGVL